MGQWVTVYVRLVGMGVLRRSKARRWGRFGEFVDGGIVVAEGGVVVCLTL